MEVFNMTNAIWGLVGVLVGSILTGLIALITTKLQLTNRKEEERLNRLIRAKDSYLIPLRETMAEWIRYSYLTMVRMVVIKEQGMAKKDPDLYKKLYDDLMSVSEKEGALSLKVNILLSQVSDINLYKQIELLKEQIHEANLSMIPMITLLRDLKDKIQPDQIAEIVKQSKISNDKIHNLLIPINERIEILLSGG
jgi:hypothetical protein